MASIRPGVCRGFLDNGAFSDWRAGRSFDEEAFARDLERAAAAAVRPDFIVAPDVVAGGRSSLDLSLSWRVAVSRAAPAYLAVQDGMTPSEVAEVLPGFAGIFVGGTMPSEFVPGTRKRRRAPGWKIRTGHLWVALARRFGIPCHIGRAGGASTARWAVRIGASSIDSSLPLMSVENLQRFRAALEGKQTTMGW